MTPISVHIGGFHIVFRRFDDGAEGLVLHGIFADKVEVIGGGVVIVVRHAVRIDKMGAGAAQLGSLCVHHGYEVVDAARHSNGQNIGGLVGGGDHQAVEQILDVHLLAYLNVLIAAAGVQSLPCGGACGDYFIQRQLAFADCVQRQCGGHHLCDAGGVHFLVGVQIIHDVIRVHIHQNGGLGLHSLGADDLRIKGSGGADAEREENADGQDER